MYDKKRSNTNQLHQDADGAGTTAAHGQGGQIGARAFREIFIDADACGDVLGLARLQNVVVGVVFVAVVVVVVFCGMEVSLPTP